ncbi:50S ribosomal protein L23 [Patescibacteria group bacterium]
MQLNKAIIKPIVTEKTMALESEGKYVFRVNMKVSKGRIAEEIEKLYKTKVDSVSTMIMPGKKRRVPKTSRFIKTKKWKKAVVQLKEGENLDIYSNK